MPRQRIPHRLLQEIKRIAPGWRVELTNGNHLRLTHPSGGIIHTAYSPSDHRARRNLAAHVRRYERQRKEAQQ